MQNVENSQNEKKRYSRGGNLPPAYTDGLPQQHKIIAESRVKRTDFHEVILDKPEIICYIIVKG